MDLSITKVVRLDYKERSLKSKRNQLKVSKKNSEQKNKLESIQEKKLIRGTKITEKKIKRKSLKRKTRKRKIKTRRIRSIDDTAGVMKDQKGKDQLGIRGKEKSVRCHIARMKRMEMLKKKGK